MNPTSACQDNAERLQKLEEQVSDIRAAVFMISVGVALLSTLYIFHVLR